MYACVYVTPSMHTKVNACTATMISISKLQLYADALKFSDGIKLGSYFSFFLVPSAPATNPAGTVTSSTSIFLEWDPPDVSDQNGVIIGYVVNVTVIATGEMFQLTTTSTNLPLDSLQPFTT